MVYLRTEQSCRCDLFRHRDRQAQCIEPQAYIADVIEKIASGWPASRWDELMLWNWTAEVAPVNKAA